MRYGNPRSVHDVVGVLVIGMAGVVVPRYRGWRDGGSCGGGAAMVEGSGWTGGCGSGTWEYVEGERTEVGVIVAVGKFHYVGSG